jgi:Fibronectin type III domain
VYSFEPTVVGSAGGIAFSISGQPAWAQFNAKNGSLVGTPKVTDEGTTGHIVITAKNSGNTASMTPFSIRIMAPTANSGGAELTWMAPTENTDGSPVTDLAGYRIYYGSSADEMTSTIIVSGATSTSYQLAGLAEGTYYFSIVAYNSAGLESGVSAVIDQKI